MKEALAYDLPGSRSYLEQAEQCWCAPPPMAQREEGSMSKAKGQESQHLAGLGGGGTCLRSALPLTCHLTLGPSLSSLELCFLQ